MGNNIKNLMKEIEKILLSDEYRDCVNEELIDDIEKIIIKYRGKL